MKKKELIKYLGSIAKSGTTDFIDNLTGEAEGANLIGQFGLGFYSSFLVASKVREIES